MRDSEQSCFFLRSESISELQDFIQENLAAGSSSSCNIQLMEINH